MSTHTVTVNAEALRRILTALEGSPHEIRELQAIRNLPGYTCPITKLVTEFNSQLSGAVPTSEQAKLQQLSLSALIYYQRYAQDESSDDAEQYGICSAQQATHARALRDALINVFGHEFLSKKAHIAGIKAA